MGNETLPKGRQVRTEMIKTESEILRLIRKGESETVGSGNFVVPILFGSDEN